jgi:cell division transport system permease protein
MRRFITFLRLIKVGGKNFIRNAWLSVAATAVMFVALTIVLAGIVLNMMARNVIQEVSKQYRVSIYLVDGTAESDRAKLKQAILANDVVSSVTYLSQEDARKSFVERFQGEQALLQGLALVGGETLPASFEVSVTKLQRISEVKDIAARQEFSKVVDGTSLGKTDSVNTINRTVSIQHFIVRASIVIALIFAAISVLIIFNTIRMAIFNRSDEIRIMKLIGATPSYIRGPFLIESSIYGIIAAILANSAVYTVLLSIGNDISAKAEYREAYNFFMQPTTMVMMVVGAVLAGILVGILSSSLAMEKYLKLKHW